MGYDAAINKAWKGLQKAGAGRHGIRFFSDEFQVDVPAGRITGPDGRQAKDFVSILLLHYFQVRLGSLPRPQGTWISFKELSGGEQYYPAFRKRSIDLIIRKYGDRPEAMLSALERLPQARRIPEGDAGILCEAFEGVPLKVILWGADEEFSADATILFDSGIGRIFSTEDVAVLAGFCPKYI